MRWIVAVGGYERCWGSCGRRQRDGQQVAVGVIRVFVDIAGGVRNLRDPALGIADEGDVQPGRAGDSACGKSQRVAVEILEGLQGSGSADSVNAAVGIGVGV